MTAPAAPRPTPLAVPRRAAPAAPAAPAAAKPRPRPANKRGPYVPRTLTAQEYIAPGRLEPYEHFRPYYALALTVSHMTPHARLVGHDLLWRANHTNGRLAAETHPSLDAIAASTGLLPAQVAVAAEVLRTRGWLIVRHLKRSGHAGAEAWDLAIPAGVLEEVRVLRSLRPRTRR